MASVGDMVDISGYEMAVCTWHKAPFYLVERQDDADVKN